MKSTESIKVKKNLDHEKAFNINYKIWIFRPVLTFVFAINLLKIHGKQQLSMFLNVMDIQSLEESCSDQLMILFLFALILSCMKSASAKIRN